MRYLTEAMLPRLTAAGFACEIFDNPLPGAPPLLVGERHEGAGQPTVLTYGHGDTWCARETACGTTGWNPSA